MEAEIYYDSFQFSGSQIHNENIVAAEINDINDVDLLQQNHDGILETTSLTQSTMAMNYHYHHNNFQVYDNEIKSELIKSESSELAIADNRINCRSINELQNTNSNQEKSLEQIFKCYKCPFISISIKALENHKQTFHSNTCNGGKDIEIDNQTELKCPGCENIHYSKITLETHLKFDHQMLESEVQILVDNIIKKISLNNESNNNNGELKQSRIYLKNVEVLKNPCLQKQNSSRLLVEGNDNNNSGIKSKENSIMVVSRNNEEEIHNVETQDSIYALSDHDQTLDNNLTFIDLVSNSRDEISSITLLSQQQQQQQSPSSLSSSFMQQKKNKISIKSVDVLREPSCLNNNQNFNHHYSANHLPPLHRIPTLSSSVDSTSHLDESKTLYDLDNHFMLENNIFEEDKTRENLIISENSLLSTKTLLNEESQKSSVQCENPERRAKIYIKNVDILKEPIFLQLPQPQSNATINSFTNVLMNNEELQMNLLNSEHNHYHNHHQHLHNQPKFAQTSSQTIKTPSQSQSVLPNPEFSSQFSINNNHVHNESENHNNYLINTNHHNTADLPPPPPPKIYIKNVDILKEPQPSASNFQERFLLSSSSAAIATTTAPSTSSLLHLRTVDELNLMNTSEVQNLITPVLDQQNILINQQHQFKKNSDNIHNELMTNYFPLNDNYSTSLSEAAAIATDKNWIESHDTINCLEIDSNSSSLTSNVNDHKIDNTMNFDLNTPQRPSEIDNNSIIYDGNDNNQTDSLNESDNDEDIFFVCDQEKNLKNYDQQEVALANELNLDSLIGDKGNFSIVHETFSNNCSTKIDTDIISHYQQQQQEVVEILDDFDKRQDLACQENFKENEQVTAVVIDDDDCQISSNVNIIGNISSSSEINEKPQQKLKRGRPVGSKQCGITKLRKQYGKLTETKFFKCNSESGCALRFKKLEILEIHKKCHVDNVSQDKCCPECKQNDFKTWDTLHTHLWRQHQIDMELYSCDECNFKTPILSRLINTHKKIHSDEKNFKCDQCQKAFKNARQLKNHRRIHRNTNNRLNITDDDEGSSKEETKLIQTKNYSSEKALEIIQTVGSNPVNSSLNVIADCENDDSNSIISGLLKGISEKRLISSEIDKEKSIKIKVKRDFLLADSRPMELATTVSTLNCLRSYNEEIII